MEDPGQLLRKARDRLNLTVREVEEMSRQLADRYENDEFAIAISRLSDIENRSVVPSVHRIYSLCVIYRLDFHEVIEWFGVHLPAMAGDASSLAVGRTHLVGFRADEKGSAILPLSLDPGVDLRRTTFISRMVQQWGQLPLSLLRGLEMKKHRYGFIGTEDWTMYPLIRPGSFVLIDETRRRIVPSGWASEFDRPVYFIEHREGFSCGWCSVVDGKLIVQPHPGSQMAPEIFDYANDVDVVGQVVGVAMRLDPAPKRRTRS